jgi:hypothetical protein
LKYNAVAADEEGFELAKGRWDPEVTYRRFRRSGRGEGAD